MFGTREELRATPAGGWRFTRWNGACGKAATCSLYIGPVTSVGALFTENLAPQLQSVKATGKKSGRKLTVRLSVRHAAQARLQLRRDGATKVLADRRFALKGGANRGRARGSGEGQGRQLPPDDRRQRRARRRAHVLQGP